VFSDEHRRKISEANKGRVVSAETRRKISAAQRGLGMGNKNALGHKHTEDAKRKMSEARKRWWAKKRVDDTRS